MRTLDYFYEEYVSPCVDFVEEFGEGAIQFFSMIISFLLWIALFVTLPLWIIPYELRKQKGGAE